MSRSLFIPGIQRNKKAKARTRILRAEILEPRQMLSSNDLGLLLGSAKVGQAPTVASPAAATSSLVTGASTVLSVLGADAGGAAGLIYSWSTMSEPNGAPAPTFSANGSNAAQDTTVTFDKAGSYTFAATITDAGLSVTSDVKVVVNQTASEISVTPTDISLHAGATEQFAASGLDQFGNPLTTAPTFTWSTAAGTISSKGVLTVPTSGTVFNVTAADGGLTSTAAVTIIQVPTVAKAAAAAHSPVTGVSTALSVLGAEPMGASGLACTWSTTSEPGGAPAPTFSANGSNAAQNTTVTFAAAGTYSFLATITDPNGVSVTSSVTVVVNQSVTHISVTPGSVSLHAGATQPFAASGLDQFGNPLTTAPSIAWSTAAGTITSKGVLSVPTLGTVFNVTATDGGLTSTAAVTIIQVPTVAKAATAAHSPVTGVSTALSVLGAEPMGASGLAYTWSTTSEPGGAPAPAFSANGSNAAQNTTVTFAAAGAYSFLATITDPNGVAVTSSVVVVVNQTLSEISVTPGSVSLNAGATEQFSASGFDQFGNPMTTAPSVTWSTATGTITSKGLLTVPALGTGFTVTAANGAVKGTAVVTIIQVPTVAKAAAAAHSSVTSVSTALSVLGAEPMGASGLAYTWSTTSEPGGAPAPTFSANGSNAAQNTTVTFGAAGTYTFLATITDPSGLSVASSVTVVVNQTPSEISVTPGSATLKPAAKQQFAVSGLDQFGDALTTAPTVTWSTNGGTIGSNTGLLTAPTSGKSLTVTAADGSIKGTALVTLLPPPTVATAAAATPATVTGVSTVLSVLGADAAGASSLVYAWTITSLPGGAPAPTFSANSSNAAQDTTVTFAAAGTYTFLATITDSNGLSATSSVRVVVSQAASEITVTPGSVTLTAGAKQQFAASGLDQFGNAMASVPNALWSTSAGSITQGGLLTAPLSGTSFVIMASVGMVHNTAAVTLDLPPTVARAAFAMPNIVTGATTDLQVLGADAAGESSLTYTWTATSLPGGAPAPTFSANGSNAAQYTTVTFYEAGSYTLVATITDPFGLSTTSSVAVTVNQSATRISISPANVLVVPGGTQQFAISGWDQFGNPMANIADVVWLTTAGICAPGGLLMAPISGTSFTVTAETGVAKATAAVTLAQPPTVTQAAAAATSSPVTGVSTALSVLGADDEGASGLTYTWTTTSLPSGAAAPTFSANGTNAAQDTTVTFHEAGSYTLVATVTDPLGLSTTSSVTVVVNQTLSKINVTPGRVTVVAGGTQQFAATGLDQFGNAVAGTPNFTWSTTAGSITTGGLLTAPSSDTSLAVTASSGGISGTATVTAATPPTVAQAAAAASSPVTGVSTALSVLGADVAGESSLLYTWSISSQPGGASPPTFSANGGNAAKNSTVTFYTAGTYTFVVTMTDPAGLSATSTVTVVVDQTLTQISVTPAVAWVSPGGAQQFTATALDQFGNVMASTPGIAWSASAGTISSGGLLTAPGASGSVTVTAAAGGVQGTAGVSVSGANFLGLKDPVLARLVQSLFAGGSITRDDMIEILDSLATGGNLSATDFSDLQTIVSDAAELNMPDYVQVLASDVIDGNVANATYQGQSLGNLAAGSSPAVLNDLVGKWFLGSDLPVADAYDCYNNGQPWSYAMASGSLFAGTPSTNDEAQGLLGDCYFISALGSLADASPTAVENMFIDNGDNTWTVRFYHNGAPDYVTVNRMLPVSRSAMGVLVYSGDGDVASSSSNVLWIDLAEKAYVEWNQTGDKGRGAANNCYSSMNGGWMGDVYAQVLGYAATDYCYHFQSSYGMTAAQYEAALVSAMTDNLAVSIGTDPASSLPYGLVGDHAYAVTGYDSSNGTFTLYNPWGCDQPTCSLTWSQLQSTCMEFSAADPSGSVPISSGVGAGGVGAARSAAGAVATLWQRHSKWMSSQNVAAVDAYFRDF